MPQRGWFLTQDIPTASLLPRHGLFPRCLGTASDTHGCFLAATPAFPLPCDALLVLHLCLNLTR